MVTCDNLGGLFQPMIFHDPLSSLSHKDAFTDLQGTLVIAAVKVVAGTGLLLNTSAET